MFDSIWLDIVIGLITVFLVFSLVTSGVRELFAQALATRSKHLWNQLSMMLDDEPTSERPANRGVRTTSTASQGTAEMVAGAFHRIGRGLGHLFRPIMAFKTLREWWGSRNAEEEAAQESVPAIVGKLGKGEIKVWQALYAHPFVRHLDLTNPASSHTRLSHIPPRDFARTMLDLFLTAGDSLENLVAPLRQAVGEAGFGAGQHPDLDAALDAALQAVNGLPADEAKRPEALDEAFAALRAEFDKAPPAKQQDIAAAAWCHGIVARLTEAQAAVARKFWAGEAIESKQEKADLAKIRNAIVKPDPMPALAELLADLKTGCERFARGDFGKITNGAKALLPAWARDTGLARIATQLVGEVAQTTEEQIGKLRTALSGWFDSQMTALSTSYRTRTRVWSFVIGLSVAIFFNVDAIGVGTELYGNENVRASLVNLGTGLAEQLDLESTVGACIVEKETGTATDPSDIVSGGETKEDMETEAAQEEIIENASADDQRECVNDAVSRVVDTGLPIGWDFDAGCDDGDPATEDPPCDGWLEVVDDRWDRVWKAATDDTGQAAASAAGWVLTGAALSFGAPFWYDLLKRASGLRRRNDED